MSALEIELGPAGAPEEFCIEREVIVPPYEPNAAAAGPPLIELGSDDVVLEPDGEGDFEIVLGEPVETENVVRQRGDELGIVLRAFAEDLPVLRAGSPTLSLSVATALMNLGCDVDEERVRILRMAALRDLLRPLPSDVGDAMAAGAAQAMASALSPHVVTNASDVLHARFGKVIADAIGHDGCTDLSTLLMREVTTPFRQRCLARREHLADLVWRPMHEAFRLYIGFTLAGLQAERGLVAPFVEFIKNGNFPLGFLKDRTFLVITG